MTAPNKGHRFYSLIVSGERFELTKDQLESDPGNYFATFFLGDFAEASNGCTELIVAKEPKFIRLIHAHLRGYTILPLSPSSIPEYMTPETALLNLMADAQYYGLQMLIEKIERFRVDQEKERRTLKATVNTRPKRYRLAQKGLGRWISEDITESGFNALFQRQIASPNLKLGSTESLRIPGFSTVLCWYEDSVNTGLRTVYALLESSSNGAV
ncbi:hypothetical protein CPB86DRAFT_741155 [Serendipita vermifera]|nr:hypothetical protein CPB86DRAFT_741155 [Serendipita vermifera]